MTILMACPQNHRSRSQEPPETNESPQKKVYYLSLSLLYFQKKSTNTHHIIFEKGLQCDLQKNAPQKHLGVFLFSTFFILTSPWPSLGRAECPLFGATRRHTFEAFAPQLLELLTRRGAPRSGWAVGRLGGWCVGDHQIRLKKGNDWDFGGEPPGILE